MLGLRKWTKTWHNGENLVLSVLLCVCVCNWDDLPFRTKHALSGYCAYSKGLAQMGIWQPNDDLTVKAKESCALRTTPSTFTLSDHICRGCLNHQTIPDVMIREPLEICGASDEDMNNSPGSRHWECSLKLYSKDRDQLLLMLIKEDCLCCSGMFFTFKYYSKLISVLHPYFEVLGTNTGFC